jgi:hypothetical protein
MTLSYTNQTNGNTTTVFSEEMGRIVYETDSGSTIAYQGGGVWRSDGSGNAVMISPPEFHYRGATLTLPLVTVGSSGTVGDRAVISQANTTRYFPNQTKKAAYKNPLENARVEVSVTSEYYRAWGTYFETRTDGTVEYDHPNNKVTLALVTPLQNTRVTSATSSLSASGSFEINGAAGNLCGPDIYTNSYNSTGTDDGYCAQEANGDTNDDGDIVYGGDVDISGGAGGGDLRGDVTSGGKVYVGKGSGSPDVYGNISHTDGCNKCDGNDKIDGEITQISGVDKAPAINGIVQTQVNETEQNNDNADAPITGETLNYTSRTVELSAGTYYLQDLTVASKDTVTLNTTEGDIYIGVQENVVLESNATIEVVGDGNASVYVLGTGGNANQLSMASNSNITNSGDDAPQFRMFGQDDFTGQIGDGSGGSKGLAKYVGVIYAPPGTSGTGTVTLKKGTIYGGVLTGTTSIANGNGGSIHYDEALRTQQVLTQSDSIIRVTYIHASTNEVRIEDG